MEIPSRECYVLRIYRRDDENPEILRGIVEIVGKDEKRPIGSIGDVQEILRSTGEKLNEKQKKTRAKQNNQ